jgi:hypothetical protein
MKKTGIVPTIVLLLVALLLNTSLAAATNDL